MRGTKAKDIFLLQDRLNKEAASAWLAEARRRWRSLQSTSKAGQGERAAPLAEEDVACRRWGDKRPL